MGESEFNVIEFLRDADLMLWCGLTNTDASRKAERGHADYFSHLTVKFSARSRRGSVQSFLVTNPHSVVCLVATTDQIHISVLGLSRTQLCWIKSINGQQCSQRNTAWTCFQTVRMDTKTLTSRRCLYILALMSFD